MFFWYAKRLDSWTPRKGYDQPYKISDDEKANLWPFTDHGLGYALDMHERDMGLDELMKRYPPPADKGGVPTEPEPTPPGVPQVEDAQIIEDDDPPFDFKEDTRTPHDFLKEYIAKLESENAALKRENASLIETITRLENGAPTDG